MRRRDVIMFLAAAASCPLWPLAGRAQDSKRIYRIGALSTLPRSAAFNVALYEELQRLGFVEGENLALLPGSYAVPPNQLEQRAAEFVKAKPDVIIAGGDAAIRAAQHATTTLPILALTDDMLGSKFVRSLAKPGGNTTGVSLLATELDGKRQDILIEAMPGARRLAALADSHTTAPAQLQNLQDAARARGIALSIHAVANVDEIVPAIEAAKTSEAAALNVLASPLLFANRKMIMDHVTALRLPAMYQWPEEAEQGGLFGYGPRIVQIYRDIMARKLVELLRGTNPADIPVEQPSKFELVINLQAAKAIGFEVPALLVARADKVIE